MEYIWNIYGIYIYINGIYIYGIYMEYIYIWNTWNIWNIYMEDIEYMDIPFGIFT